LIRNILKGNKEGQFVNTLLVGNTGTGKTQIVNFLAKATERKLFVVDLSSISDAVSALLGTHRLALSPDGKNTISVFSEAPFVKMIQTENAIILLDEISRANFTAQHILYELLDNRRKLTIEITGGETREIPVAKGVTFIATANVGSEYVSAQALDRALLSRFMIVEFGNIPSAEEESVLVNRTHIEAKDANMIVKVANNIRNLYNKQEISTTISIRETLMTASLVADGFTLSRAMEIVYLPIYESPDGTVTSGERGIIYKTISSY
jgi:MoxR-like ATPase